MTHACLIIIGNEILSGRTQDKNIAWIAVQLNESGVQLKEVRVIPDDEATIIETVNTCRKRFSYVLTTGGIGPTHDDITTACIAKAFGVALRRHEEAEARLTTHYGVENLNAARLKMADIPEGAELIDNPVSAAPGFYIGNVFVMAGVPRIMQAMFDNIRPLLQGGKKMLSTTLSVLLTEGVIAAGLSAIQHAHPEVEIGSYPFIKNNRLGTSLVIRSMEEAHIAAVSHKLRGLIESLNGEIIEE